MSIRFSYAFIDDSPFVLSPTLRRSGTYKPWIYREVEAMVGMSRNKKADVAGHIL